MRNKKETLCWLCEKAMPGNGCDWSTFSIPIEGWCGKENYLQQNGIYGNTYNVIDCPLFELDQKLINKSCADCFTNNYCKKKLHGLCADFMDMDNGNSGDDYV